MSYTYWINFKLNLNKKIFIYFCNYSIIIQCPVFRFLSLFPNKTVTKHPTGNGTHNADGSVVSSTTTQPDSGYIALIVIGSLLGTSLVLGVVSNAIFIIFFCWIKKKCVVYVFLIYITHMNILILIILSSVLLLLFLMHSHQRTTAKSVTLRNSGVKPHSVFVQICLRSF